MPEPNQPSRAGHYAWVIQHNSLYLGKSSFQGGAKLARIQSAQTRVCMPPGPVYNWLAVAHSALVILDHALQYRAAQVTRIGSIR